MLDHVAKLPRSGHDVGQSLAFTASTGMLLPIYADFLNSSESVHIKDHFFGRTQPLVTPALCDVDIYLDWFFVPMTMLFTAWGQVRWQITDFLTSFYEGNVPSDPSQFPLFEMNQSYGFAGGSASYLNQAPPFYATQDAAADTIKYSGDFECNGKAHFRMLDLLGFNPDGVFQVNQSTVQSVGAMANPSVFPWKALAYQCIYQNYYRNDDYEPRNVRAYNVDNKFSGISKYEVSPDSALHPFTLRYADYRKDYFTTVKAAPITAGANILSSTLKNLVTVPQWLDQGSLSKIFGVFDPPATAGNTNSFNGLGPSNTAVALSSGSRQSFTGLQSLRSAFALEKMLRITGRASKDYDAQTLAHFGFKVPHDVKHDITKLRTSHGMLSIGEVVSSANTFNGETGSALGEIAGKGYLTIHNNKPTKFTAPVDGALLCIFRAIPRQRIINVFDKENALAYRTDLYIPEYDKLGMQPLYNYEFDPTAQGTSEQAGWQLRYQQYKQKPDRASRVFTPFVQNGINQYSAWVLTRVGLRKPLTVAESLKCPPTALNSIMAVPYQSTVDTDTFQFNGNPAASYYTDPFICDFRADVKKVSPMSPTGEPDMMSF